MRPVVILLAALPMMAACVNTPHPFEHATNEAVYQPSQDKLDVTIETPANMPQQMADRLAAALAVELQAYGIVAALQPAHAPLKLTGAMSTRDAKLGSGIEIEIDWYLIGDGKGVQGPAVSKTNAQSQDYAEASDWLVSRMAQQAAPRVAALMGHAPDNISRSLGQVAAGVTVPENPSDPALMPAAAQPSDGRQAAAAPGAQAQVKVMVGAITGAPSDGDKQLFSGMRRALGSSKVVVSDKPGPDIFTVTAAVTLSSIDDQNTLLSIKWVLKDAAGKEVGNIEQSNPVPVAATRGSWAGFGDIVAAAAVDGVLELLNKALEVGRH